MKKIYFVITLAMVASLLPFLTTMPMAHAQADEPLDIRKPDIRISIPGLDFTDPSTLVETEGDANGVSGRLIHVPYIAEYIAAVYRYAVIIASILAVVMVIVAGFQWTTSGGSADAIGSAKKRIGNAVVGLVIALGSYTLLFAINPELVQFRSLKVNYIEGEDLIVGTGAGISEEEEAALQPNELFPTQDGLNLAPLPSNYAYVRYTSNLRPDNKRARPDLAAAFDKAMRAYHEKFPEDIILVNSGFRTVDDQIRIRRGRGANAAPVRTNAQGQPVVPTDRTHTGGNAVDIQIRNNPTEVPNCANSGDPKLIASMGVAATTEFGPTDCISKKQQQLIGVMLDNGFCVALNPTARLREPWHFEYPSQGAVVSPSWCIFDKDILDDDLLYMD